MKRSRRRTSFRIAAVLLAFLPFVLFELICRWFGWGAVAQDSFVEFENVRPLFVLQHAASGDGSGQPESGTAHDARWTIAENRRGFFAADSFAAHKAADEKRIFVLGGSTVQGRPFSIETSFGTFLELAAAQADDRYHWDVIHCGGVSYASYRLVPILAECLRHQPDAIIICCGHNEFLEAVTYADVIRSSALAFRGERLSRRLHSVQAVRRLFAAGPEPAVDRRQPLLPQEVQALLDYQGGFQKFTRQNLHRDDVVHQFGRNLNRMIDMTTRANVPVMLVLPPSNLRDCPPFKSEFGAAVADLQRQQIRSLLADTASTADASSAASFDPTDRIGALQEAVRLDPQFAFSWYRLGQQLLSVGRNRDAAAALTQARDEDVCPLRMTSALQSQLLQTAADRQVLLVDVQALLRPLARDKIVGDRVLVDHVHPSFNSHQQIALQLLAELGRLLQLPALKARSSEPQYRQKMQSVFADHLQSLDSLYYLRGRRTLADLKAWAAGRADGARLPHAVESRVWDQP